MFSIKICGITNVTDALAAEEAGADAIGLNFYSRSLRVVDVGEAKVIADSISEHVTRVGVFVDQTPQQVNEIVLECGLDVVQLHGDQDNDFIADIDCEHVVRAIRWSGGEAMLSQQLTTVFTRVKAVLLDAQVGKQFGGTGTKIPWEETVDVNFLLPLILAGGLTPENVAEAITIVRPNGVDVAGGVESFPGKKDAEKIAAFVTAAKNAMATTSPKNTSLG